MKRPRIIKKSYVKEVSSDNMVNERDARIQVYNCIKSVYFNDALKVATLVTM